MINEISLRECLKAELLASDWSENNAELTVEHMTEQRARPEVIYELTLESRRVLASTLNLYHVTETLDRIVRDASAAGDYRAAAIAAAKLADLIPALKP